MNNSNHNSNGTSHVADAPNAKEVVAQTPSAVMLDEFDAEIEAAGGEWTPGPDYEGSIGRTMFDLPQSKDNIVPVLLPRDNVAAIPSQSLVRIRSLDDERQYQGIVVEGPFHDPDGLRADAPIVVTTTVRGASFMPHYHGRVMVEIIGEIVSDGEDSTVIPPRFRPLPNSPVWVLDADETARALKVEGDLTLGLVIGRDDIEVRVPSNAKAFLPRHMGVLGTTGGGKSTTMANLINELQKSKTSVVLFDTEGEYTQIDQPTEQPAMVRALERRERVPAGVKKTQIVHLVGRETSNPEHPFARPFTLRFADLAPYTVMGFLDFNNAQEERYLRAYEVATRRVLYKLGIYPATDAEKSAALEIDDLEEGYPKLTLDIMADIVRAFIFQLSNAKPEKSGAKKAGADEDAVEKAYPFFKSPQLYKARDEVMAIVAQNKMPSDSVSSWGKVLSRLTQLQRLKIFDNPDAEVLKFEAMTRPGNVTIVDLSGTDSTQVNNLVIASVLRGLLEQQELNAKRAETGEPMRRVSVVIEEAHEFLSAERVKQMPELFQQVARIARRGRKRWLGLIFVTQLPQHLPDEVLGLLNSHILHKIGDASVISRLKRSIGGMDGGLWDRLPNLAPGQAIVSTPTLSRALLVAMDPAPCRLRLAEE